MVISISAYEKSSTYKFIKEVKEINQPLNQLGVTYFIYAELKEDYYISCLVNNDKMIRDFINHNGLKYELSLSPHKIVNDGVYLVSTIKKPPQIRNYYKLIFTLNEAVDQIVYIIDHNNLRKVYIFGVLDPFYINKEYLELFILYFNDKASCLINNSKPLRIPKEFAEYNVILNTIIKNFIIAKMEQEFLTNINAKYYKIKQLEQQYLLSTRETQCLELILENKIAREIADFLNLSTRTAETY
ncbi:MAG: helix-turn-helix transcriptional regulator, partial [Gammaproteobacteria bacterium]